MMIEKLWHEKLWHEKWTEKIIVRSMYPPKKKKKYLPRTPKNILITK